MTKGTAARTITVNPLARRCGVDDQIDSDFQISTASQGRDLVDSVLTSAEFGAVSDRLLQFAEDCDREMDLLQQAVTENSLSALQRSSEKLSALANDVGASDLMRLSIQLQILINQNQKSEITDQVERIKVEVRDLKKKLRIS